VSEVALSKIYPQTHKKTLPNKLNFKLCMKKAW